LKTAARGTTFIFSDHRAAIWNWEKKKEEDRASGCYRNTGELFACFNVSGHRRPFSHHSHACGHAAASLATTQAGVGRPEAVALILLSQPLSLSFSFSSVAIAFCFTDDCSSIA
jgi:hypothetical protein